MAQTDNNQQPPRSLLEVAKQPEVARTNITQPHGNLRAQTLTSRLPPPSGADAQSMQQLIAAAVQTAMVPLIAQIVTLKEDMEDMKNAEMEIEEDLQSEASASTAKKTRKFKILSKPK